MTEPPFVCERLGKRFARLAVLNELDLELAPGQVTVLLGTNGAGKTTLLRLALGVLRRDAGTLRVLGVDPQRDPAAVRARVGYVPASPDAYPWMSPRDLYAFLRPHYPGFTLAHALALAGTLGVPLDRAFAKLSRGEAMKAMLVAALAHRPRLLLLDEPFSGLDPLVRDDVLCATHELEVAARLADRVAILAHGRVERHGTLGDVLGEGRGDGEPAQVPDRLRQALREAQGDRVEVSA